MLLSVPTRTAFCGSEKKILLLSKSRRRFWLTANLQEETVNFVCFSNCPITSPAVQVVLEGASSIPAAAPADCCFPPPPARAGADGPPFTFWFPITLFGINRDTFRIRCFWTMRLARRGRTLDRLRAAARWTLQGPRKLKNRRKKEAEVFSWHAAKIRARRGKERKFFWDT